MAETPTMLRIIICKGCQKQLAYYVPRRRNIRRQQKPFAKRSSKRSLEEEEVVDSDLESDLNFLSHGAAVSQINALRLIDKRM